MGVAGGVTIKGREKKAFYVEKVFDLGVHIWNDGNRNKSMKFILR